MPATGTKGRCHLALPPPAREMIDDGMDDVLVARGLLQCIAICVFVSIRFLIDVHISPWALDALSRLALSALHRNFRTAWCAPLFALGPVYFWCSLQASTVVSWAIRCFLLGTVLGSMIDHVIAVCGWKKRHAWIPLAWWVTFTRVSSGREAPRGVWCGTMHRLLCSTMPWLIRFGTLSVLLMSFQPLAPLSQFDREVRHHQQCTSFTNAPVSCDDLHRVRKFNREVMPGMSSASYHAIRKAMDEYGLPGHLWHVGHACPDPSKRSKRDKEDFGWNLFAQHVVDNYKLGHCLVSCAEADYLSAYHVRCTQSRQCVRTCEGE